MNLNFQNRIFRKMVLVSRNSDSSTGFTLLEVLIAMAILAFISFAIYQATSETYKLRDTLSQDGNFYNGIRMSISIMQRDISLIYSPNNVAPQNKPLLPPAGGLPPPVNSQQMGVYMSDDLGRTYTFWGPALDNTGIRPSHFIGTENSLSFVSVSHIRIYKDSPESDFSKITYSTRREDRSAAHPEAFVLIKTESPNTFATDDAKDNLSHSYDILHGIKKITFLYYRREGDTWKILPSWDSDKEDTKNLIPDLIELNLEVLGPKTLSFDGIFKFKPEIPLNGINPNS